MKKKFIFSMAGLTLICFCALYLPTGLTSKTPEITVSIRDNVVFAEEPVPLASPEEITTQKEEKTEDIWYEASIDLFNQINNYRVANGLKAYVWSDQLYHDAKIRATEAMTTWSHTRPNGQPWWSVDPAFNYGECLAKEYKNNTEALIAWQTSPTHNAIVLQNNWPYAAVGICNSPGGYLYWALEVGIG